MGTVIYTLKIFNLQGTLTTPPPPTRFLYLGMSHPVTGAAYVGNTSEKKSHFSIGQQEATPPLA